MRARRERIPHVDDPVAMGRRLREARIASGLSQRELAFPGCSPAYISRIEQGERIPSLQVLRDLRLAAPRDDIPSRHADLARVRDAAQRASTKGRMSASI